MLPHRLAGARLAVGGDRRRQHGRTKLGQSGQALARGLGAVGFQQNLAQLVIDGDGRIRGGVNAAGNAGVDLPEGDLVADGDGRFQPRAAGLLHVKRRGFGCQPRRQYRLAGQVEVSRVLEHRAGGHLAEALAVQLIFVDHTVECRGEHGLVRLRGVGRVRAGEGNAGAANNGDLACLGHGETP